MPATDDWTAYFTGWATRAGLGDVADVAQYRMAEQPAYREACRQFAARAGPIDVDALLRKAAVAVGLIPAA